MEGTFASVCRSLIFSYLQFARVLRKNTKTPKNFENPYLENILATFNNFWMKVCSKPKKFGRHAVN